MNQTDAPYVFFEDIEPGRLLRDSAWPGADSTSSWRRAEAR